MTSKVLVLSVLHSTHNPRTHKTYKTIAAINPSVLKLTSTDSTQHITRHCFQSTFCHPLHYLALELTLCWSLRLSFQFAIHIAACGGSAVYRVEA